MKRLIWMSLTLLMFAITGCEPGVDSAKLDKPLAQSDWKISIEPVTDGGNEFVMTNETPGTSSYWNWGTGYSNLNEATVALPFLGEAEVTFVGIADGGASEPIVTKINIDHVSKPVDEWWNLLGGSEITGKTWVWYKDGPCYGTAGYGNDFGPSWNSVSVGGEQGGRPISADDEMIFDLNGKANFTKKFQGDTETGTFAFSKYSEEGRKISTATDDDGNLIPWSYGELTITGSSVLSGERFWGSDPIGVYEIIKLTETEMVLSYAAPGTGYGAWNEATYWVFQAKE